MGNFKIRPRLPGDQKDFIAVYFFPSRAIQNVNGPRAIGERPHPTTSASAGGLGQRGFLAFEALALIAGTGHENGSSSFAFGISRSRRVPGDIDVPLIVRRHRTAAVQTRNVGDEVAFGLKARSGIDRKSVV